ncbi:MAG: M42 family peptidase [Anaerolineae bacterium]|jgi:tetrahedral aminopeptidase|nr:M42 family peptidase [Anaerolineae bacterium]MBT7074643.1 M42 family peptidase [Anaerolineae bacterium]MBT7781685.1 M42 family peptidase [Anaerolineae bacterium]
MLKIKKTQLNLLEKLTNAVALPGDEGAIRKIVRAEIEDIADEIKIDSMGNLLVTKRGRGKNHLKVMLAAHMDEVGFMLVDDEKDGIFRFETLGGLDPRQLVGKPVWVGKDKVEGVIGAAPVHLISAEERNSKIPLSSLRIDVGLGKPNVKVGDRATFATKFLRMGDSIRAKALDDRLGVAILIELLKNAPDNIDLLAAFTVQEEVGLRGAKIAAHALNPDLALAVDSTPAYDMPMHDGSENIRYNTKLGAGPAIYTLDGRTISDPRIIRWLSEAGDAKKIPYQYRQPGGGGTDAGSIHLSRAGIPTGSVSVPGRYAHTAMGLCRIKDWENTLNLLHAALSDLSPKLLAKAR